MREKNDAAAIREIAHAWHIRLSEFDLSENEKADFQAWLEQDPRHEDAYERAVAMASAIRRLSRDQIDPSLLPEKRRRVGLVWRGQRPVSGLARSLRVAPAALVLMALAFIALPFLRTQEPPPTISKVKSETYESSVGQHLEISLADGSSVALGPGSEISVVFSPDLRRVIVHRGSAYFDVESDVSRPFKVTSNLVTATVLGTQFDIRHSKDLTRIAVAEGRVSVSHPLILDGNQTSLSTQHILSAGQQVAASPKIGFESVLEISPDTIGEWRNDRLVYNGARLAELVSDADRYTDKRVLVAEGSEHILDLKISGAFNGRDFETMLATLEAVHPISVDSSDQNVILLVADAS